MQPANQGKPKTWWGAIWRGLVVDEEAKHYRNMKSAVWLFIYLLVHADRSSGKLQRKYATIARDMQVSEGTIRSWMQRLRHHHYIHVTSSGRGLLIHIRLWKTFTPSARLSNLAQAE
ncbi:MAG TPA: hypothetical protein VF656_18160 [Pyrinomonadaceae bacterium]